MIEKDKITEMIKYSLDKLYENDGYLILNENMGKKYTSERCVLFRFGVYFNEIFNKIFNEIHIEDKLNVDCEYNRNKGDQKIVESRPKGSCPDFVLHKRGNNEHNIVVIEFKCWWSRKKQSSDEKKIEEYCDKDGIYKYQYGATVFIAKTREEVDSNVYSDEHKKCIKEKI